MNNRLAIASTLALALSALVSTASAAGPAEIGTFRNVNGAGQWYLDKDNNHAWTTGDAIAVFGVGASTPLVTHVCRGGNEDSVTLTAVQTSASGALWFHTDSDLEWDGQAGKVFGVNSGKPFFHGANVDAFASIFQGGSWFFDTNGNGVWNYPGDYYDTGFGVSTDVPISGYLGDVGGPVRGIFRDGLWVIDSDGNGVYDYNYDDSFSFGQAGDIPVVGDFWGDGKDEIGVFRDGVWYMDKNRNRQWNGTGSGNDAIWNFGSPGDKPIVAKEGWSDRCYYFD